MAGAVQATINPLLLFFFMQYPLYKQRIARFANYPYVNNSQTLNIREYKRHSETEMACHRLKAFHTTLLEISVWESFDEKH